MAASRIAATGTVGQYSYTDTAARPGVIALYKYNAEDGFGWLKRLYVNPPKMKAVSGMEHQTVGWMYNVQRKICGFGGCGRWQVTYQGQTFGAYKDAARAAWELSNGTTPQRIHAVDPTRLRIPPALEDWQFFPD